MLFRLLNLPCFNSKSNEKGIATNEFAVALPFIMILIFSIVDIGAILNQYLLLTDAVSAGLRKAMGDSSLVEGTFAEKYGNPVGCAVSYHQAHGAVQERVHNIINIQNSSIKDICISSQLTKVDPQNNADNTVTVKVNVVYQGFFALFNGFSFSVQARAPYLGGG